MDNIEKTINNLKECVDKLNEIVEINKGHILVFEDMINQLEEYRGWKEK